MERQQDTAIILSDRGKILNILCYEQVYKISSDLTSFISKHITEAHQCVGLRMTHNIYIPSILLSLQELQNPFIFLPAEETEIKSIIDKLKINWILSFSSNKNCIDAHDLGNRVIYLEKHSQNQVQEYKDIYYIIRTSGTTDQSKFVKVGKYSIESNIKSMSKIFNIAKNDVIYFGTRLTFDPSMIELLLALNNRACLLITSLKNQLNSVYLYETLFHPQNGISILQIVPSLFMRWPQHQIETILLNNKLRILAFGGEPFPQSLLSYNRSEKLRIFNLYGITEVSCWASIYEIPKSKTSISLGNVMEDTLIEVRNKSGMKIVEGEGEIFIGSKKRICLLDDESEDDKVIFRKTGDLGFINKEGIFYNGRKDDVYKRFGHKIHLIKIEELVRNETSLNNRCIWSKKDSKVLLFLIIEKLEDNLKDKILDKIRVKLLHALPKHYFPDYIDIIRKCPVTSHGKTNKHALQSMYLNRSYVKETEEAVDILKLLICNYVGLSEEQLNGEYQKSTFFEIGGNSILAIQLLNEFKEKTGTESPEIITALLEKDISTCFECASLIKAERKKRMLESCVESKSIVKKVKNNVELRITWTYNFEACVDAVPIVFQFGEKILVAVGSFSHIFSVLDAQSGTEIAKFVLPDVIEGSACTSICHNLLYVGCFDGCLYCLDFINKKIKWVYATNDRIKCKPTLCCKLKALVFGSYDKYVHCVDASAGTMVWKTWVEESVISTPLVKEGKIYVVTLCGTCLCLLEANGQLLWKHKTGSPVFGTPCIVGDIILIPKVNQGLLCISPNGEKVQEIECGGQLYTSPTVYKDFVIFSCHDRHLYILEVENRILKIKLTVNIDDILSTPCVYHNQIAVAGCSGRLFLVDLDGGLLTDLNLPGNVFSSAVIHENNIFVGCRDNNLYCVKICNL